ncbi:MAG TPA: alkaline phosphatase family protein [Armatimonadota bacterium]|jgi:predicted AlkP superfamily phosphohydrolase/phosphomutase
MSKVFVLGIDALSPVLLARWAEAGHLPNFERVMEEGQWGPLQSTGEFSSPQAWPSFMTGVNPGRHGIFSFLQHVPYSYDVEHVTSRNLQAPTVFQMLTEAGARVASLNIPCTYPVAPLNGVGIADWLCPSIGSPGATYPVELADKLRRRYGDYPFHVDIKRHARAGRYGQALHNCLEGIRVKQEVGRELYEQGPWDLFALVFVETDAAQHYFWHFSDPEHPLYATADRERWGEPILEVYKALDQVLGEWLERLDDDTTLLIMSDHGGAIYNRGQTYIPGLLKHLGLLTERRRASSPLTRPLRHGIISMGEALHGALPKQLKMRLYNHPLTRRLVERFFAESLTANNDWTQTRAYSYYWETAPWINLAGREPQGLVAPGAEYEAVRDELIAALESCIDETTGEPAVERAFRREEVYSGPCLEYMPDVGIRWNRHITLEGPLRVGGSKPGLLTERAMDVSGITGGHDPLGTVALWGPELPATTDLAGARIEDLTPTILALLDQPLPEHLEGRPLSDADTVRATVPKELVCAARPEGVYNADEERLVSERLRNLGYM